MNLLAAALVAVIGSLVTLRAAQHFQSLANPVSLFVGAWTICLSAFALRLLPYAALRFSTVVVVAASAACFVGGVYLTKLPGWRALSSTAAAWLTRQDARATPSVITTLMLVLLGLEMLSFVLYIVAVARVEGLSAFWTNLAAVRILKPQLSYPAILLWAGGLYCWMLAAARPREDPHVLPRWLIWGVPVALIPFLLTTGRTELFFLAITAVVARFLARGPDASQTRHEIAVITATGIVLLGFFVALSYLLEKEGADVAFLLGFPPDFLLFVEPYVYASGGFAALDQLMSDVMLTGNVTGPLTFWPLHRLLYALGVAPPPAGVVANFVEIPFLFNTFTYLEPYYRDYGVVGCVAASVALGTIGGVLFQVAVGGGSPGARIPYSIFAFGVFISPFVNHFSQLMVPFLICISIILTWAVAAISHARQSHAIKPLIAS